MLIAATLNTEVPHRMQKVTIYPSNKPERANINGT